MLTRQGFLPDISKANYAIPSIYARSALFAINAKCQRTGSTGSTNNSEDVPCWSGWRVTSSDKLHQADLRLLLAIVAMLSQSKTAAITASYRNLLHCFNKKSTNANAIKRIRESLLRLSTTSLSISSNDNSYQGVVLNAYEETNGRLLLHLPAKQAWLWQKPAWVDADLLTQLTHDFTRFLYLYITSHEALAWGKKTSIGMQKLIVLSGSKNVCQRQNKWVAKRALTELYNQNIIADWCIKNGIVEFTKLMTIEPQPCL